MLKQLVFRSWPIVAALLAAFAAAPASAQSCTSPIAKGELVTEGKIALSTNPTLRPLQYIDETGALKGMNIDLGNEIAKRLCLSVEFIRMDAQAMIAALKSGRFDGIDTGMFWTEERSKVMYNRALCAVGHRHRRGTGQQGQVHFVGRTQRRVDRRRGPTPTRSAGSRHARPTTWPRAARA